MEQAKEMSFETKRKMNVANVSVGSIVECTKSERSFKGKIEVIYNNSAVVAQNDFDKSVISFKDMSIDGQPVKVIKQVINRVSVSTQKKKSKVEIRGVEKWDSKGEVLLKTYDSVPAAAEDHGVHKYSIYRYLKGKPSQDGFMWKWQETKEGE